MILVDVQEFIKAADVYNKTTVKQAEILKTPPKPTENRTQFIREERHFEIKLTPSDRELLKKLDKQHREKMAKDMNNENIKQFVDAQIREEEENYPAGQPTVVPNPKSVIITCKVN